MSNIPRLVVDTNVFISSLISSRSAPSQILKAIQAKKIVLLVSDPIVNEYLKVLEYPRIRKYPGITDEFLIEISALLVYQTHRIEVSSCFQKSPDPDDNKFLELAVDGNADFLVTGDKRDLLILKEIQGIPILLASGVVKRLKI